MKSIKSSCTVKRQLFSLRFTNTYYDVPASHEVYT